LHREDGGLQKIVRREACDATKTLMRIGIFCTVRLRDSRERILHRALHFSKRRRGVAAFRQSRKRGKTRWN